MLLLRGHILAALAALMLFGLSGLGQAQAEATSCPAATSLWVSGGYGDIGGAQDCTFQISQPIKRGTAITSLETEAGAKCAEYCGVSCVSSIPDGFFIFRCKDAFRFFDEKTLRPISSVQSNSPDIKSLYAEIAAERGISPSHIFRVSKNFRCECKEKPPPPPTPTPTETPTTTPTVPPSVPPEEEESLRCRSDRVQCTMSFFCNGVASGGVGFSGPIDFAKSCVPKFACKADAEICRQDLDYAYLFGRSPEVFGKQYADAQDTCFTTGGSFSSKITCTGEIAASCEPCPKMTPTPIPTPTPTVTPTPMPGATPTVPPAVPLSPGDTGYVPACGNGVLDEDEECEPPGAALPGGSVCSSDCEIKTKLEAYEECSQKCYDKNPPPNFEGYQKCLRDECEPLIKEPATSQAPQEQLFYASIPASAGASILQVANAFVGLGLGISSLEITPSGISAVGGSAAPLDAAAAIASLGRAFPGATTGLQAAQPSVSNILGLLDVLAGKRQAAAASLLEQIVPAFTRALQGLLGAPVPPPAAPPGAAPLEINHKTGVTFSDHQPKVTYAPPESHETKTSRWRPGTRRRPSGHVEGKTWPPHDQETSDWVSAHQSGTSYTASHTPGVTWPGSHESLVSWSPHVQSITRTPHDFSGSWPPHTTKVTFPPNRGHASGTTWLGHTKDVTWPHESISTWAPPHPAKGSWPPHRTGVTYPPPHESSATWAPHSAGITWPVEHNRATTWPEHETGKSWKSSFNPLGGGYAQGHQSATSYVPSGEPSRGTPTVPPAVPTQTPGPTPAAPGTTPKSPSSTSTPGPTPG